MNDDERQARIAAIRSDLARPWQEVERAVETARWLLAELDAATARAERSKPCPSSLEYRDGVACSGFGDADACTSHQVIRGLRKHAVDADRWELRTRDLTTALRRAKRWLEGAEETFAASMDCGEEAYQSAEDCILGDSYCERARDMRLRACDAREG